MIDLQAGSAFLVGTAHYHHLPDLPGVLNNLEDLRDLLADVELIGMNPDRIHVVRDPSSATEVATSLRATGATAGGVFLVYLAGHGLVSQHGVLHFAMTGTRDGDLSFGHALPIDWLREAIQSSAASRRVLVLDSCYSGLAVSGLMAGDDVVAPQTTTPGTWTLASSTATRPSMARPGDRNTAFTGALLRLVREGLPDGSDYIDAAAAFRTLRQRLLDTGDPVPMQANTDAGQDIRLARNRSPRQTDVRSGNSGSAAGADDAERLAQRVSVSVRWPDKEVRVVDALSPEENYWVVYVRNSGDFPIHDPLVVLVDEEAGTDLAIAFPAVDPGERLWYILRPDTPFPVQRPAPRVWIEFTALSRRWRSTDGQLERLPSHSDPRATLGYDMPMASHKRREQAYGA